MDDTIKYDDAIEALVAAMKRDASLIEASKKLLRKNGLRPPTEGRGPAS